MCKNVVQRKLVGTNRLTGAKLMITCPYQIGAAQLAAAVLVKKYVRGKFRPTTVFGGFDVNTVVQGHDVQDRCLNRAWPEFGNRWHCRARAGP